MDNERKVRLVPYIANR